MLLMACVCLLVAGLKDKEGVEEFSKSRDPHVEIFDVLDTLVYECALLLYVLLCIVSVVYDALR